MSATTLLNQASAMQTANGNTSDLPWGNYTELAIDINCTGKQGTSPTLQIIAERKDAAGNYMGMWQTDPLDVSGASGGSPVQKSVSIGVGLSYPLSFAATGRIRWVIGGSATPGALFSLSVQAK